MSIEYKWTWGEWEDVPQTELELCSFCGAEVPVHNFPIKPFGVLEQGNDAAQEEQDHGIH